MSRTIIITGASQGIGKATAEAFLAAGWTVGCLARSAEKLEDAWSSRERAMALPCDVTDSAAVDAAFDGFVAQHGQLDAIFNNAGRGSPAEPIDEITDETWHAVLSVNVTGMFNCARAAFRHMRAQTPQGGRIVNNGSISAHVPREGSVGYTTTKHAITGLTRTLSLDGREYNIACGQIDIGNARTPMVADLVKRHTDAGLEPPETMDVADAVRSILMMADMPLDANVQFMTVMATKMPYIGRG